jgi:hypothetical protein
MFGSAAWRTFRDIDALANEGLIDWANFLQMAQQARAESACYWTLRLAHDVSGVVVPGEVLTSLRARVRPHAHRLIEQHLAQELTAPQQGCPSYRLRRWLWEAAIRPGASGHGHRRPWHVGDDASWAQLERGDRSEPQRFRGARVRRVGAAVRYLAGSALAARREV